ncbi:MAG: hypothetical protein IJU56_04620 [Clostridia bacterium]|nr:hypothetical protein [Clostridia bacterium]
MMKRMKRTGKRSLSVLLSVLMLLSAWVFVAPTASAADLTISTAAQLKTFLQNVAGGNSYSGKTVELSADIDLSGQNMNGVQNNANNGFCGTFDGKGHTIKNFTLTGSGQYQGLFRYVTGSAVIQNLNMDNVNVSVSADDIAAVVGYVSGTLTMNNVHIRSGSVSGSSHVGGLVGQYRELSSGALNMNDCSNAASVSGRYSGGLVGYSESKVGETFVHCYNVGAVTSNNSGTAGGLFGYFVGNSGTTADWVWFKQCWNAGAVSGGNYDGGIIGYITESGNSEFDQCFNWGSVSSNYMSGGIFSGIGDVDVNKAYGGYFNNLYNAGTISAGSGYAYDIGWSSTTSYSGSYNCGTISSSNNRAQATQWSSAQMQNGAATISSAQLVTNTWGVKIGSTTYKYPIHSWYRNMFTFESKFVDMDSGTNQTITKTYNNAFTTPNPSKTGYTRNGNWTGSSGQLAPGDSYTAGVTAPMNAYVVTEGESGPVSSVTYDLNWTPNTYEVTLNKNDGTGGTTSVTATYDAAMPSTTMPTRAGYTFAGYYDTSAQTGGTKYYNADGSSARAWDKAAASTLWARWSQDSHTLKVDVASGMGMFSVYVNNENVADDMYTYNETHLSHSTYRIVPTPMDGYHYVSADGALEGTIIDNDVSVNLTFAINTYDVTFNPDQTGYTVTTQPASTVNHGGTVTFAITLADGYTNSAVPSCTATNAAAVTTSKSGNVITYTVPNVNGDTTISLGAAALNSYTVAQDFNGTGYTVSTAPAATVNHGGSVTFAITLADGYTNSAAPTCTATNAAAVTTSKSGNVITYTVPNVTGDTTISLGAAALNSYTVIFEDKDGNELKRENVVHGSDATPPAAQENYTDAANHYTFDGWSGYTNITANNTIRATFTPAAHVFDQEVVDAKYLKKAATCTEKASYFKSCVCGYKGTETFESGEPLDHNYVNHAAQEPTCTAVGWAAYQTCTRCDYSTYVEIPATGHTYAEPAATDWTWTPNGDSYNVSVSVSCVKGDDTQTLTASMEKTADVPAQHLENGHKTFKATATIGDQTFTATRTDTINAEGHSMQFFAAVSGVDCEHYGTVAYYHCSGCNKNFADEQGKTELTELSDDTFGAHQLGAQTAAVAATKCTETGTVAYYTCTVCEKHFSDDAAQNELSDLSDGTPGPHIFSVALYDETNHWKKCANCNETTGLAAHSFSAPPSWSEWTEDHKTTVTFQCDDCAYTVQPEVTVSPDAHEATCTAAGYTVYTATVTFGGTTYTNAITQTVPGEAATGHTYGEPAKADWTWTVNGESYNVTVTVQCVKGDDTKTLTASVEKTADVPVQHLVDGYKTFTATATIGTQTFTDTKTDTIPAPGHSMTFVGAVPAVNCMSFGTVAHYHCSVCGKDYADESGETELASLSDNTRGPHNFSVLQSDENEHWYECANGCGEFDGKAAHSGGTATCTAKAICTICNASYGDFDYHNHSTNETKLKNQKDAGYTCTGYTGDTYCVACDHLVSEGIVRDRLNINENAVYTNAQTIKSAAEEDPMKYKESDIEALDEKLGALNTALSIDDNEAAVNTALNELAALLETIEELQYFTVTFKLDDEIIKEEPVISGESATAPTQQALINNGETHQRFSGWIGNYTNVSADVTITGSYIDEPHTWVDGTVTKQATCMEEGAQNQSCACGATNVKTLAIDPENHTGNNSTSQANVIPASCEAGGSYDEVVICECCVTLSSTPHTTPSLGHSFVNYVSNNDATCEEDGTETAKCERCEATDTRTVAGSAIGHAWSDWTVTKAATCTAAGSRTRTCANDAAHVQTEVIPMIDHVDVNNDDKCDVCGRTLGKHHHSDSDFDNVCDDCGQTIDTGFRCSMCNSNAKMQASSNNGFVKFVYTVVHLFVHAFQSFRNFVVR